MNNEELVVQNDLSTHNTFKFLKQAIDNKIAEFAAQHPIEYQELFKKRMKLNIINTYTNEL